jgi:predicted small integral membrane protein
VNHGVIIQWMALPSVGAVFFATDSVVVAVLAGMMVFALGIVVTDLDGDDE